VDLRLEIATAIGNGRVRIDDRFSTVELLHHRRKSRITEPPVAETGHHANAIDVQNVERVLDLLETAVHIRQGE